LAIRPHGRATYFDWEESILSNVQSKVSMATLLCGAAQYEPLVVSGTYLPIGAPLSFGGMIGFKFRGGNEQRKSPAA
jgi:hypothetical protein